MLKVKLTSIYLEGVALRWHRLYMAGKKHLSFVPWEMYSEVIGTRFEGGENEYPIAMFKQIVQQGDFYKYLAAFDDMITWVPLDDDAILQMFIGDLEQELQFAVVKGAPKH